MVDDGTKELRSSNQKLEESNKMLQQYAFIVSHDLQEPLRKIETFTHIAMQCYLNEQSKLKINLDKILSSATRLRILINDLLNYSTINKEGVFEKVNLNTIICEAIANLESVARPLNPVIEVSEMPEMEVIPSQMRQVFQNLLSNSFKFSRSGVQCVIKINAAYVNDKAVDSREVSNGEFCRISFIDNGVGFNNQYKDIIFEIFKRLQDRSVYEGTGIGLAIVKKVIERHGGSVYATSKENEGSTFTMVLPVIQSQKML
jgi:two-component system CheB/CheR fusion protein